MKRLAAVKRSSALAALLGLALLLAPASLAAGGQGIPVRREVLPLAEQDRVRLGEQRDWVAELARRRIGTPTGGGSMRDLRVLQELLDAEVVRRDQVYELQAMGVVLGDVMVQNLGLHWVVVVDEYGRSRALRGQGRDDLFFPVTMISKRVVADMQVDVRKLYDSIAGSIEKPR